DLLLAQSLKQNIIGPESVAKNWTGANICNFEGFYCATNPNTGLEAVASVDFNGLGLYGHHLELEGFLNKMTGLALFHANSNNFTGSLPKDLSALKWLYEIDVSNNKLSGPFPRSILALDLTYLDLRFNQFSGPVPRELFSLNLEALFLNNNEFSATIPDNIGSSPISYLALANNQLSGSISTSIGNMTNLQEVLLLGNNLSGLIPQTWATPNLTVFDASDNSLSGPVPEGLCQLHSLEILNLSNNKLSGALGPACASLVEKKILDV
ncbi:hypothetical protein LZ30DRAFT_542148, partial [Colletotrichum cereale]